MNKSGSVLEPCGMPFGKENNFLWISSISSIALLNFSKLGQPIPSFSMFFFLCFVYFPWNWFVPEPPKQSGQVFVSAPQWARHTCLLFINPGCFTPAKAPPWLLSRLICSTMSLQGNTGTKWLPVSVRHFLAGMKIDWLDLITKTCAVKLQGKSRFLVVFFSGRLFPLLKFYQLWCTHSSELLTVIKIIYLDGIMISIA